MDRIRRDEWRESYRVRRRKTTYQRIWIPLSSRAKAALVGYKPVNSRIIAARFEGKPLNRFVIQIYAPNADSTVEVVVVVYLMSTLSPLQVVEIF